MHPVGRVAQTQQAHAARLQLQTAHHHRWRRQVSETDVQGQFGE